MLRSIAQANLANGESNGTKLPVIAVKTEVPRNIELDAVIVGAGFAGCYLLYRLRKEGFKVKVVEAGSQLGGVWHWNTYPGARVDSQYPIYALDIPEVYNTWKWKEQYPSATELQGYFQHLDSTLDLSRDVLYNTTVTTATWNNKNNKWLIGCEDGTQIITKFFHCCLGFSAKRHFPEWPGLETFAGRICHSSFWPAEGVDVGDKRVGVIGNGATGVQIAQEAAREAAELKVFIRTPNMCLPMGQGPVTAEETSNLKLVGEILGKERYLNSGGFFYDGTGRNTFDMDPEERQKAMEEHYRLGGFRLMFTFEDTLENEEANREMYNFWVHKTRARITDPVKREIMAPLEPPHAWAAKRLSLEQDYYEQMDKPHVKIIDLNTVSVSHVVPEGIVTTDGILHELDVLAIATGFHPITGGYNDIEITGLNGQTLKHKWENGVYTYLGLSVNEMPNFFFTYGPQSPSAYSNGPSLTQPQGDWIAEMMVRMRDDGKASINPRREAEVQWKETVAGLHAKNVRDKVDSWYTGANIPGHRREALIYAGGLPLYLKTIRESSNDGYKGFDMM